MKLSFNEANHTYQVDGVIVPSVSKLISFIYPDSYKDIPKHILQAKAEYGSRVHAMIECALCDQDYYEAVGHEEERAFGEFIRLWKKGDISRTQSIYEVEQMVHYDALYAGRFDLLVDNDTIVDIKTYATMNDEAIDKLSWQLSFYKMAYMHMNDDPFKTITTLKAIWLPKKSYGRVIDIPMKSDEALMEIVDAFHAKQGH